MSGYSDIYSDIYDLDVPLEIPTIPSLPAGYIATADDMNDLSYACSFLLAKPIVRVHDATGGQSLSTSSSSPTEIDFDTVDYDPYSMWAVGSPDLFTVQTPGWYKFRYALAIGTGTIRVNAHVRSTSGANNPEGSGVTSSAMWGSYTYGASGTTQYAGAAGVWPFYLYIGDSLALRAYTDSAVSTATTAPASGTHGGSFFSMEFVSI